MPVQLLSDLSDAATPEPFTQARWIWADQYYWDLHNCFAQFRKSFTLAVVPKKAPLFITADQLYKLYVNGKFVSRGPARGFQATWPYDEVDIAEYLVRGKNVIAVRAYNGGTSSFQYIYQGVAGLLVGARFGKTLIVSDASWKCRRQAGVQRDTVQVSVQLGLQEHIDCRLEPINWAERSFDDSAWEPATSMANFGAMPWHSVSARGIPMLQEERVVPVVVLGTHAGRSAAGWRDARDVAKLAWCEPLEHTEGALPLPRFSVPATGKSGYFRVLLDFGRTVVGTPELTVNGGLGGEIIDLNYVETINAKTLRPDVVFPNSCRIAIGSRLICRKGETRHSFFHSYGFRYLSLTVRGSTKTLKVSVALDWMGYPLKPDNAQAPVGALRTSDALLADIWRISAWTQQCCSLDAYVDTPWREQAQWWGDARVQGWNTFHLAGDARLFRRGIRQIAASTSPEGLTYGHAPTIAHSCILPDFSLIWILTLWDYYWQTGSLEPFVTHRERLDELLAYFSAKLDPKVNLLPYDKRYWLFLDWAPLHREGYSAVYNAWYLLALEAIAKLADAARDEQSAKTWRAQAARVREALSKLIDRKGLLRDGLDWQRRPVAATSVHAQTLALFLKLRGHSVEVALKDVLLPYVRTDESTAIKPSAYWITYVFSALAEQGYSEDVLACIRRRWEPMVAHGTTWEDWRPLRGHISHSHAWSAHPLFHTMQIVGGIRQTAAGWSRIRFAPFFTGSFGGATVPTPLGAIRSDWKRTATGYHVELALPKGVSADVVLEGVKEAHAVTGTRHWDIPILRLPLSSLA